MEPYSSLASVNNIRFAIVASGDLFRNRPLLWQKTSHIFVYTFGNQCYKLLLLAATNALYNQVMICLQFYYGEQGVSLTFCMVCTTFHMLLPVVMYNCDKATPQKNVEPRPIVFRLNHMFWAPIQMVKREKQMQHLRQRDRGCCICALKNKVIDATATRGWGVI